jgi:hypothetical protein
MMRDVFAGAVFALIVMLIGMAISEALADEKPVYRCLVDGKWLYTDDPGKRTCSRVDPRISIVPAPPRPPERPVRIEREERTPEPVVEPEEE